MIDYRAVEQLTLRYVLFCRARISRLLENSENNTHTIERLMFRFADGGFVAEIDIYRSQIIALYKEGKKRCKSLSQVLVEMEQYRNEILESVCSVKTTEQEQPIFDSSVFVRNDSEKIKSVIHYFAHRYLIAYMIRTKTMFESRTLTDGIDGPTNNAVGRALYLGGDYFAGVPPNDVAAVFSIHRQSA